MGEGAADKTEGMAHKSGRLSMHEPMPEPDLSMHEPMKRALPATTALLSILIVTNRGGHSVAAGNLV